MTQRDDGHDYRDSKNKAEAYNRKKVTIIWGSDRDPDNKKTYRFETEEQLKYFMMGVDEAEGWLEYQIEDEDGHDYRDSKNKAEAYNRKKVTIIWGSDRDPDNKKTYRFETEEQLKYFMMGVDEAEGWLEYQIEDEDGNIDRQNHN